MADSAEVPDLPVRVELPPVQMRGWPQFWSAIRAAVEEFDASPDSSTEKG